MPTDSVVMRTEPCIVCISLCTTMIRDNCVQCTLHSVGSILSIPVMQIVVHDCAFPSIPSPPLSRKCLVLERLTAVGPSPNVVVRVVGSSNPPFVPVCNAQNIIIRCGYRSPFSLNVYFFYAVKPVESGSVKRRAH